MSDKIGQEYEGVVSGLPTSVFSWNLKIPLKDLCTFPTWLTITTFMMMRKRAFRPGSHKTYKIGDRVKVRVDNVSIPKAEIDFALI